MAKQWILTILNGTLFLDIPLIEVFRASIEHEVYRPSYETKKGSSKVFVRECCPLRLQGWGRSKNETPLGD